MAKPTKKIIPEVLMIPLLKSRKLVAIAHSESGRRARGELKATPSTKATVKLAVKKEATMPIAIMVSPQTSNQYKWMQVSRNRDCPTGKAQSNWRPRK